MSDEITPQAGEEHAAEQAPAGSDEVAKLRQEAAKWRTQLRDAQAQLKELTPLAEQFKAAQEAQKTEAQKLADQVAAAQKAIADHQAAAERAQRELQVTKLATKAGVDLDLVPFLDLSKLDLADEKAALEILGKLAAAKATANSASNPGRSGAKDSDQELRDRMFNGRGRNKSMIFGG